MNRRQRKRQRQPQQRDRRNDPIRSITSIFKTIGKNTLVLYGTYKVSTWAWNTYYRQQQQQNTTLSTSPHQHGNHNDNYSSTRRANTIKLQKRKCVNEIISTYSTFIQTLELKLDEYTKMSYEMKCLKRLRSQKQKQHHQKSRTQSEQIIEKEEAMLWKKIQIKTITRMISSIYSHMFLYLVLYVQAHILGGKLCEEKQARCNTEQEQEELQHGSILSFAPTYYYQKVLKQTFHNFLTYGVIKLMKTLESIIERELQDFNVILISVKEKNGETKKTDLKCITADELEILLNKIRSCFEMKESAIWRTMATTAGCESSKNDDEAIENSFLISLFLPPQSVKEGETNRNDEETAGTITHTKTTKVTPEEKDEDAIVQHILNEAWDILDSPTYEEVQRDCLNAFFSTLKDGGSCCSTSIIEPSHIRGWYQIFTPIFHPDSTRSISNGNCMSSGGSTFPLVNIIPQLKKITKDSFYTQVVASNHYKSHGGEEKWRDIDKNYYEGKDERENRQNMVYPNIYIHSTRNLRSLKELGDVSFHCYY